MFESLGWKMNRLYYLVSSTFLRFFFMSIGILLFILIIDSLAMHLSALVASGIKATIMGRLLLFILIKVLSVAVPLSILAAGLVTVSSMLDQNELMAAHASGISTLKVYTPLWIMALFFTVGIWAYSFFLVPKVELHIRAIMYQSMYENPQAALQPGYFTDHIPGYTIRISDKNNQSGILYDVYIAETDTLSRIVTLADSGRLIHNPSSQRKMLILYQGSRYQELGEESEEVSSNKFGRTYFDSMYVRIPGPSSTYAPSDLQRFRNYRTLHRQELIYSIDSLYQRKKWLESQLTQTFEKKEEEEDEHGLMGTEQLTSELEEVEKLIPRYRYEFAAMHTLALSVFIFMMLGVGLGASIKGRGKGIGRPALIAVLCFVIFYVLKTNGDRLARKDVVDPWLAAFLPVMVFGPIAVGTLSNPYFSILKKYVSQARKKGKS